MNDRGFIYTRSDKNVPFWRTWICGHMGDVLRIKRSFKNNDIPFSVTWWTTTSAEWGRPNDTQTQRVRTVWHLSLLPDTVNSQQFLHLSISHHPICACRCRTCSVQLPGDMSGADSLVWFMKILHDPNYSTVGWELTHMGCDVHWDWL